MVLFGVPAALVRQHRGGFHCSHFVHQDIDKKCYYNIVIYQVVEGRAGTSLAVKLMAFSVFGIACTYATVYHNYLPHSDKNR